MTTFLRLYSRSVRSVSSRISRSTFVLLAIFQETTELYLMPNGAQAQAKEEEGSGGESQEEWESDADEGEEDAGSDEEEEEEEVAPPRSERRSKLAHDPAADRGKGVVPAGQSTKRPRTTSPAPTEKASKQPRAAQTKPAKALPKMRMEIPTVSG